VTPHPVAIAPYERVFVILRADTSAGRADAPAAAVSVLKAYWTESEAEAEVVRLNDSKHQPEQVYFWKSARIERRVAAAAV
jgi:hypothetical protein